MKWKKFTIDTTTEAVDLISDLLNDLGVQGIEIEDNIPLTERETKGMFIDILPELPPDDGTARVNFYLSSDEATRGATFQCGDAPHPNEEPEIPEEELLAALSAGLEEMRSYCDIGAGTVTKSETEDKDWMNAWKEYFRPFSVGDVTIVPAWEEIPEEQADKLCVVIEPGSAFGTGTHETTQLCIRHLQNYLRPGMEVLDLGCGSGILGIAALKLGASRVVGTDLDESAVSGTLENAARNGFTEQDFRVILGNILYDPEVQDAVGAEKYDLALSNILAPVIILLAGEIAKYLKPGAVWIASGIVQEKEQTVAEAVKARPELELLEIARQGEWVSIVSRKKESR